MGFGTELTTKDATVAARPLPARARTARCSRPRARGRARERRGRLRRAERADPARLLQGREEDRRDVPHLPAAGAGRSRATSARSTPTARSSLHGRGSVCINTGGEKVYPEEVEETLKLHPAVRDAVVVGLPDEKWGEAVTALVELEAGTRAGRGRAPRLRARAARRLQGAEARGDRAERRALALRQGGLQGREGEGERGARPGRPPRDRECPAGTPLKGNPQTRSLLR